ncbi:type II secretion system GspH family protein [Thermodesulfovibrionales bacterium]|nr:type II secretion system GspH family protein [Thermodesulfovibrionales bacterium]
MEYGISKLETQNLKLKTQSGFTLIELAIVLVVIGLLISIGVGLIGPMTKKAMHIESEEVVNAAVESIISYGAMRNHLPDAIKEIARDTRDAWGRELHYIVCGRLDDLAHGGDMRQEDNNYRCKDYLSRSCHPTLYYCCYC